MPWTLLAGVHIMDPRFFFKGKRSYGHFNGISLPIRGNTTTNNNDNNNNNTSVSTFFLVVQSFKITNT